MINEYGYIIAFTVVGILSFCGFFFSRSSKDNSLGFKFRGYGLIILAIISLLTAVIDLIKKLFFE